MKSLTIITRTFTWPDCEADEPDYDEAEFTTQDCEPDTFDREEGKTALHLAVDYLASESITSPSSSPGPWGPGTWFSYVDGSYCSNHYTGEHTEVSAHPEGFTAREIDAMGAVIAGVASLVTYLPPCTFCGAPNATDVYREEDCPDMPCCEDEEACRARQ